MTVDSSPPVDLEVAAAANPVAYGPIAYAKHLQGRYRANVAFSWQSDPSTASRIHVPKQADITHIPSVVRYLYLAKDNAGHSSAAATAVHHFIDLADRVSEAGDFQALTVILERLDQLLSLRSFVADTYEPTAADFAVWGALKSSGPFAGVVKKAQGAAKEKGGKAKSKADKGKDAGKDGAAAKKKTAPAPASFSNVLRWFNTMSDMPPCADAVTEVRSQQQTLNKAKKDQGSFEISLPGAKKGAVVTRFPPEPSGYLHIGHIKAALLNAYFAEMYEGKLLLRFDDTNPSKEKSDFEDAILHDLDLLKIHPNKVSHTSDHFPVMLQHAEKLISKGLAYADDTEQETMRKQRMDGIPSARRDASVEENRSRWQLMQRGSPDGSKFCLRAKISVDAKNKALRDPVIYRVNNSDAHHQTGRKYNVYPTYDFACPIVDSVEGVTHALRTNEYRDREAQYQWFIKHLELRPVAIWEYSRMNFVYTLLSKRKLQWFVDQGRVTGWDDPRFPTVRGILRRGMTVEALKQYILMQGASTSTLLLEWDKLWSLNKRILDPIAPRHTALDTDKLVPVTIVDGPAQIETKAVPLHKKNEALGMKQTAYFKHISLAREDVLDSYEGEQVTLMDWGNAIVTRVDKNGETVRAMEMKLNLAGDVKSTKKKLTWLVRPEKADGSVLTKVLLRDFDYLITKKKMEEADELKDCLTPVTLFETLAVGDAALQSLKKGTHIQLERRGYYIVETPYTNSTSPMVLLNIPDGKASSVSSKHQEATPAPNGKAPQPKAVVNGPDATYEARAEMLQSVRDHSAKLGMYEGGFRDVVPQQVETSKVSMFRTKPFS